MRSPRSTPNTPNRQLLISVRRFMALARERLGEGSSLIGSLLVANQLLHSLLNGGEKVPPIGELLSIAGHFRALNFSVRRLRQGHPQLQSDTRHSSNHLGIVRITVLKKKLVAITRS